MSPAYRTLVVAVAALRPARLRMGRRTDSAPYARLRHRAGRSWTWTSWRRQAVGGGADRGGGRGAVLYEPVLQALHRLAQEEESARRYGCE